MRFVKTTILKYKLAAIFKQAEQLLGQGKVAGDQPFLDLANQAQRLLAQHIQQYSDFNPKIEIPAWSDLVDLTIKPEPVDMRQRLIMICVGVGAAALSIGAFSAMVGASYHLFEHLFHFMGL